MNKELEKQGKECQKRIRDWENLDFFAKLSRIKMKPANIDYMTFNKWLRELVVDSSKNRKVTK